MVVFGRRRHLVDIEVAGRGSDKGFGKDFDSGKGFGLDTGTGLDKGSGEDRAFDFDFHC